MNRMDRTNGATARNVRRLGHLDLPGAGQVTVAGQHAYVGHIPNKQNLGTSIVDISDSKNPRLVATVILDNPDSHSHKVRVAGGLMVVNHERNPTPVGRRAEQLPGVRRELREKFGREPSRAELAQQLNVTEADLVEIEAAEKQPYRDGGFRIYDIVDPSKPKLIHHQLTGGIGVHRFDMDERYAYISTEMEGFIGNILVIYDLRNPKKPGRSHAGGCPDSISPPVKNPPGRASGIGCTMRCASTMKCGRSCWHGGFRIVDVSDLRNPKTVASYNYHPPFPEPTHTVMPVPVKLGGRRIAVSIDEEDQAQSANEEEARRGVRMPACQSSTSATTPRKAARAVRGERTRLAICPHARRALRCASVPRAYGRHSGVCRVVQRRLAHCRSGRPVSTARSRLLYSRARRRKTRAAEQ